MKTYNKYPTGLKIQYTSHVLLKEQYKQIPKSTRTYWSNQQMNKTPYWQPSQSITYDYENVLLLQEKIKTQALKKQLRECYYLLILCKALLPLFIIHHTHYLKIKPTVDACLKKLKQQKTTIQFWKWMPFTYHQWCAWRSRKICQASLLTLCKRRHPNQLTSAEVNAIKSCSTNERFTHWSLISRYYQLMREGMLFCSKTCFYKYCRSLNITVPLKRKKIAYNPLRATVALQMLHLDVTIVKLKNGGKLYLHVIKDNFSKAILACKVAANNCSKDSMETLKEVLEKYNLMQKEGKLITDDGQENKGALKEWMAKPGLLWKQLIAQLDIAQSNSMVEAANKILKYQFLKYLIFDTLEELQAAIPAILLAYNNMPLDALFGLTPQQILDGKIPNKYFFKEAIAKAQKNRIATNQQINCTKKDSVCKASP